MTEKSKALVKRSTALIKFNPKVRKELVIRGLTALDQVRDADFYFFKGKEHVIRGEYDDAIENCEKAIELNPEVADYYHYLGRAQKNLSLYDDAIENYENAIELNSKVADYYYEHANAQYLDSIYEDSLHEDAIGNYVKAIELNPKDSFYYQSLGHAQDKLNLYDDAIENYKKAIELKPEVVSYASLSKLECYRHIALCYKKMGLEHLELEYWEKRDSLRESRRGNG